MGKRGKALVETANSRLNKKKFVSSLALFALFIMFTVSVKLFDSAAIGESNTCVGFSSANLWFFKLTAGLGGLTAKRMASEYIFAISAGIAIALVCFFFWQLSKVKSLKKVDQRLFFVLAAYADLLLTYFIFKLVKMNYGPTLHGEIPVPSYPSFCCLSVLVILETAIPIVRFYIDKKELRDGIILFFRILMGLFLVLRALSGADWLTDIVGAFLLGASMLQMYGVGFELGTILNEENKENS